MPRSRSSSPLSMARSCIGWFARTVPLWRSKTIDQGRLAVIDMGNDGDVAQVHGCAVLLVKSADETDARLVRLPNSHLIKGLW